MRHPHPLALAAGAAVAILPACSCPPATEPQPTAGEAPKHSRHLHGAEVTGFFATDEGRETLRLLDESDSRIFYDGRDRFVQINTTISPTFGGRIPSLTLHSGWMHPDSAVERGVMLPGTEHDNIRVDFTEATLELTILPSDADRAANPDAQPRQYTISWPQGETPQAGWIMVDTGQQSLLPLR
jgi:hypothetical protein